MAYYSCGEEKLPIKVWKIMDVLSFFAGVVVSLVFLLPMLFTAGAVGYTFSQIREENKDEVKMGGSFQFIR